jgi:P2X purinoceptor 4
MLKIFRFAIVYKKGYQEIDNKVNSVVTTKVKGTLFTNLTQTELTELQVSPNFTHLYQRIWDAVDYVIPASGGDQGGFFIITNIVITPNQTRGACPEVNQRDYIYLVFK